MKKIAYVVALVLFATPGIASASSPESWAEFYEEVKHGCTQKDTYLKIVGDVFSSESFGFVLMTNQDRNAVCVYNKRTKEIEIAIVPDVIFTPKKK